MTETQPTSPAKPNLTKIGPPPVIPDPPPIKHPAAPFAPANYSFSLDKMRVSSLCSALFDDQDQIVASLTVNNTPVQPITYNKPGVGVGDHNLGFQMPAIQVRNPEDKIVYNYVIANVAPNRGGPVISAVESILKAAAQSAIGQEISKTLGGLLGAGVVGASAATGAAAGAAAGSLVFPVVGSAVGALVGFLMGEGFIALADQCDGIVAAEQFGCTGQYLWEQTHSGSSAVTFKNQIVHDGPRAKDGCTTPFYQTFWSVNAV